MDRMSSMAAFTKVVGAGSFSAAGSLTVVTNYNFRFMLAPANLTEGPSWDASKEKWIIPWKDENERRAVLCGSARKVYGLKA